MRLRFPASLLCLLVGVFVQAQEISLRPDNIDDVIARMTLKEKATLVVGAGYKSMLAGQFGFKVPVPGAAGMTQAIPRLGIPAIVLSDGPAGVRIQQTCTGFPIGSMLSSTWNTVLIESVGAAIGAEALAYGVDVLLAPGMNLQRNPLCGRNFEYFSEDPLLSGLTAAAYIRGVQGQGVGTSAKHFAANNQETNRFWNDSRVASEVLEALYLRGFEIAVKEAQPWTVMASYNRLNGIHTQQDRWLLTDVLRARWGFQGLVMTDWTGKRDTPAQIAAGCDLMEPGGASQTRELIRSVKKGELPEAALDTCVRRVLELIVKTPTFKGVKRSMNPDLEAHAPIAREAAEEGIVLLDNSGALPLQAGSSLALFGVGSYQTIPGGTGSGHVHRPYVVSLADGLSREGFHVNSYLSDIYTKYLSKNKPKKTFLSGMLGSPAAPEMPVTREMAAHAAKESDIAVVTISRQAGEGGDRHLEDDFLLTAGERQALEDISEVFRAQGKPVVVVLNIGGVIETASWKHLADAILLAWQPGQEGGEAIARVLDGTVCPSGRLPVTFPVDYFDLPSSANFPYNYNGRSTMASAGKDRDKDVPNVGFTDYAEGMAVGYRAFTAKDSPAVSYPFGHGLSYTSFEESAPVFSGDSVTVTVTNIGPVPGKHAVIVMNPTLCAFGKTRLLASGESETLVMKIL